MCSKPERMILATLMDDSLPHPRVHQIRVRVGCDCGLEDWILALPDLPFLPMLIAVENEPVDSPVW